MFNNIIDISVKWDPSVTFSYLYGSENTFQTSNKSCRNKCQMLMHQGTLRMRRDLMAHAGHRIRSPRHTGRQMVLLSDLFNRKSAIQKLALLKSNTAKARRTTKSKGERPSH